MSLHDLHREEISSVSRIIKKSSGSYSFRVEGYSGLTSKVGDSAESPEFTLCDHLWQLRLFPGGSLEEHKNFVSYYIASKSQNSAKASYKLSICSQVYGGADESFTSSGVRLFEAKGSQIDGWGRDKFISSAKLQNPDFGFWVNDSVVFKVEISVYGDLVETDPRKIENYSMKGRLPSLSGSLKELFLSGDLADVTIQLGNGELRAHRLILSARSPVFKAMLQHEMSEKATGVIEMDDVAMEVMQECLTFMYTDACSNETVLEKMAEDLLSIASKYQVSALSALCESHLCRNMAADNAADLFRLADTLGLIGMKESVMRYIASHITEVTSSESFSLLDGALLDEAMSVINQAIVLNKNVRKLVKYDDRESQYPSCHMM